MQGRVPLRRFLHLLQFDVSSRLGMRVRGGGGEVKALGLVAAAGLLVWCALVATGCATDHFSGLPADQKALFNRCNNSITPGRCVGTTDLAASFCAAKVKNEYADQPTVDARKSWLTQQGCAPSLVAE